MHEFICEDISLLFKLIQRLTEVTQQGKLHWTTDDHTYFHPLAHDSRWHDVCDKFCFSIGRDQETSALDSITLYIDGKYQSYHPDCNLWDTLITLKEEIDRDIESKKAVIQSMIDELNRL